MSRQKLTLAEQETIILWDNGVDTAEVYTHDARLISKLRELSQRFPDAFVLKETGRVSPSPTVSPSGAWASARLTVRSAASGRSGTQRRTACHF